MMAFLDRPALTIQQRATADQARRSRMWWAELNEDCWLFLLRDEQVPAGKSVIPSRRDPFGSDKCARGHQRRRLRFGSYAWEAANPRASNVACMPANSVFIAARQGKPGDPLPRGRHPL
jgi:hypothetical protein